VLDLFDIFEPHNLSNQALQRRNPNFQPNSEIKKLRSYDFQEFIKKFLRLFEQVIQNLGIKFIQKYCIEKMRGK